MSGLEFVIPPIIALLPLVVTASLVGVIISARAQSMLPDALSHAIYPGIVCAVWLSGGSTSPGIVLVGAMAAGLFALGFTKILEIYANVSRPVSLACVYPSMLSLGLMLTPIMGLDDSGFDVHSVFFGSIDFLFWPEAMGFFTLHSNQWLLAIETAPPAFALTLAAFLVLSILLTLYRVQLTAILFDNDFARLVLFKHQRILIETIIVITVTLAAVAAFLSVGAIMAVALFSAPALIGRSNAQNLTNWLVISAIASLCCAIVCFTGIVLIPEVLLPTLGVTTKPIVLGTSLAGTYAVVTSGVALATLLKK